MRFTTLCITALGFIGLAISQATGSKTTLTTRPCSNPKYCTTAVRPPPSRSNVYSSKETTDSTELTRTITAHRRQLTVVKSQTQASVYTSKSVKTHNPNPPPPKPSKSSRNSEAPGPSEGFSDSVQPTRVSVTAQHRQALPNTATCNEITSVNSKTYAAPISTHIQCGPDKSKPTCSTSYECGCHSSAFTWTDSPDTHLCWPPQSTTIKTPDYSGGRSQRWVARQAKATHALRAASQDLGGRPQRLVARQVLPTFSCYSDHDGGKCRTIVPSPEPTRSCPSGAYGPDCPVTPTITATNNINARQETEPSDPVEVITVTATNDINTCQEAGPTDPVKIITVTNTIVITPRQEPDETSSSTEPEMTANGDGCPPGICGPACRSGHYCNKLFGRVASGDSGVPKESEAARVD